MRIISIVGKIDARVLAYPLARALGLNGATAIVADDGSFRRLFAGRGNIGTVNGIDVSVVENIDNAAVHSLDKSGTNYDNLIVVSNDYVYPGSTGIIVCHGLDRSMMASDEEDEEEEFIFPIKADAVEEKEPVDKKEEKKEKKPGLFSKGKPKKQDKADEYDIKDNYDTEEETEGTENTEDIEGTVETKSKKKVDTSDSMKNDSLSQVEAGTDKERAKTDERDLIVIPDNIQFTEVQVAFEAAPKKGILGISLKDGLLSYIYKCEEGKRLLLLNDKVVCTTIAKLAGEVTDIDAKEIFTLLGREEGRVVDKKKKK